MLHSTWCPVMLKYSLATAQTGPLSFDSSHQPPTSRVTAKADNSFQAEETFPHRALITVGILFFPRYCSVATARAAAAIR